MDNSPKTSPETLQQKQGRFALMVAQLIQEADRIGYVVTLGDAYRDPRAHGAQGIKVGYSAARSAHKFRLAIDIALFEGGRYLTETQDHAQLGQFWRSLGGTWGGDWGDGNHYSIEHQGIK